MVVVNLWKLPVEYNCIGGFDCMVYEDSVEMLWQLLG